ncbi:MAG TPA: protein-L-isoaspartate O-methyltransferase [Thermoplasmata archaeon]|jgi:protein-L-isoaspartate(D-aspartate) O-methyltransferase|nr:MAG TPA: protein-L-isoaspartate O-methyltransferase [Thermoplasmata archaeon]
MYEDERERLIINLLQNGYIKTEPVKQAFLTVPREAFIPDFLKTYSYVDTPLDIGQGQTISAPHMVAIMCEALDIKKGQKILEVGTGSGYHAAIVAQLVGETGKVYTIERFESLAKKGKENLKQIGCTNVIVEVGDGSCGLPSYQPYDRIYVTCAAPCMPQPLIDQLHDPGKLLVPIGDMYCELTLLEKEKGKTAVHHLGGCVFVPLVGKYGH